MNPFKNKNAELTKRDKIKGTLADVLKRGDTIIGLSGPNTISIDSKEYGNKTNKRRNWIDGKRNWIRKMRKRKTINWIIYWKRKTTKRN